MLISRRSVEVGELGASVATLALAHSIYRVHVVKNRNVTCDDAMFLPSIARMGHVSRPVLTVILAGSARVRVGGFERWLEPGDAVLVPQKGEISMRQQGVRFDSVAIEWSADTIAKRPAAVQCGPLDAATLARVAASTHRLVEAERSSDAALCLAELLASLRSWGVPFENVRAADLIEEVPQPVLRLSRALDLSLSRLESTPMLVDLNEALGISERQLHRIVRRFNDRYGFNSAGWRDTIGRRRLLVGTTMMTAPGARTEDVAHALGYASPTSFCHALAQSGLPSPGAIAGVVARIE